MMLTEEMLRISLVSMLFIMLIFCGMLVIHGCMKIKQTKGPRQMKQNFTILFVITSVVIIGYILSLLIPHTIYIFANDGLEESTELMVQAIAVTFYSLILATLETTFIVRLLITFDKKSTNKLSKPLRITTWIITIYMTFLEIAFVIFTLLIGFGFKSELFKWIGYFGYLMMISYSFSSVFIVFMFAKKLHNIIETELEISGWKSTQQNIDKKTLRISDMLAKYLLLALTQFIVTLICASGMITSLIFIYLAPDKYYYIRSVPYIIMNIDVIINAICLYLQYSFAHKYYLKYCNICHIFCRNCSLNCVKINDSKYNTKYRFNTHDIHVRKLRLNTNSHYNDNTDDTNTRRITMETNNIKTKMQNEIHSAEMKSDINENESQRVSISTTMSALNIDAVLKHVDLMDDIMEEEDDETSIDNDNAV